VESILEKCGHTILKKCHDKNPNCSYKCIDRLDCGHACEKNCHKNNDPDHEEVLFIFLFLKMIYILIYSIHFIIL